MPLAVANHALPQGIVVVPFGAVGFVVALRQSRNPIGWILLGLTIAFLLSSDGGTYALLRYHDGHTGLPLARAGVFFAAWWIWLVLLLPLPIMLFPDGRLPGRWRPLLWVYLGVCALVIVAATVQDAAGVTARHITIDSNGELTSVGSGGNGVASTGIAVVYVAFCLASVGRQLGRYRRSSGESRQQLKWLLSGGAVAVAGLVLTLVGSRSVGFGGVMALPVGLGIGILKYRLYEIDRLISRTISYAIVTGVLVGVFVGIVALTTDVLPFSSPVAVAASTLAAAALFNPLRQRVQRLVDRRFNRSRYDAEATVAALGARLRDAVDLETVQAALLGAVDQAVAPAHVSIWIRPAPERG